jgi:hypothetical protein
MRATTIPFISGIMIAKEAEPSTFEKSFNFLPLTIPISVRI